MSAVPMAAKPRLERPMRQNNATKQIENLISKFDGQFMRPMIHTQLTVSQIDNEYGESRWAEQGDENLDDGESITETFTNVSLCRLSAPGYVDCTDWELCHDENDILEWLEREFEKIVTMSEASHETEKNIKIRFSIPRARSGPERCTDMRGARGQRHD